jgi:MFS family permease
VKRLFAPYRSVFATAGARSLFFVAFVARIPMSAKSMALTLHVVIDQHKGYGAAGIVGMAMTIGSAIGAPILGKQIDKRGLRPVLLLSATVEIVYWSTAAFLPYPELLAATCLVGILSVPAFSVMRQAIAAKFPEAQRRQAFSLDSMLVEMAFMIGPAVAVLAITSVHRAAPTMVAIGVLTVLATAAMIRLDPPIGKGRVGESAADRATQAKHGNLPRGAWLTPGLLLVLSTCMAANLVLSGTEVSVVATLRGLNETQWAGLTIITWCFASLVGGFWHGSTRKPWRLPMLMLVLGLGTAPVGLAGHHGWYWLCLVMLPAGFFCAPTLASTTEAVSNAVPPEVRGQAMGLQGSALTIGGSVGAPLAGIVIDHSGPDWGFVTIGLIGGALALVTLAFSRRSGSGPEGSGPETGAQPALTNAVTASATI